MSENIVFPCPACGTKYSVAPHHAGKKTKCKKCAAPITVPSPEVANPTIVGSTRTIRRADIESGAPVQGRGAAQPKVDMSGGSSVLRKKETVAAPAQMAGGPRGPRPPRPAHAGHRPMPPGAYPPGMHPPRKKNNAPMIIGIVSGAVALVLIVVLIVVVTNDDGAGTSPVDNDGEQVADTPDVDEEERVYEELQDAFNNKAGFDDVERFVHYYNLAKEHADKPRFQSLQIAWASELAAKARRDATSVKLGEVALMLDDDGYDQAQDLLEEAWQGMAKNDTATVTESYEDNGVTRKRRRPSPIFQEVVTRLGWVEYKRPAVIDDYARLEIEGEEEYNLYFDTEVAPICRTVELYPPHVVEKLNELEAHARQKYEELLAQDADDGFAVEARKAWIRFKSKYDTLAKVDRAEGKRAFSPKAMERQGEGFDNIWTYTYWRPFMVYVEKPKGMGKLDDDFIESLHTKAALLRNLVDWFNNNLKDRFNLQRVKPQYDAQRAEDEGWPLEIVVLKDQATFEKFVEDVNGQPMPGARAFYSPLEEQVMTYDDRENMDEDTQWFNESVLIHETFHMLSDFYAAKPMFTRDEMQARPRYANILVQEGLTDSVSGFARQGDGKNASYEFLRLNHLRLRSFQNIYELLENRTLFRIRDMIRCRHYGQCQSVALERAQELEINPFWATQNALGIYYPTACQASYFFHTYKEGGVYPYREKWWSYIGQDYQGQINVSSYRDNRGIAAFEQVFEIESEEDWDELEQKWLDYTMSLDPEDVGKSGAGEIEGPTDEDGGMDDEGTIMPGVPSPPGGAAPDARQPAYAGRDEN